jgi:hypothetical protein
MMRAGVVDVGYDSPDTDAAFVRASPVTRQAIGRARRLRAKADSDQSTGAAGRKRGSAARNAGSKVQS